MSSSFGWIPYGSHMLHHANKNFWARLVVFCIKLCIAGCSAISKLHDHTTSDTLIPTEQVTTREWLDAIRRHPTCVRPPLVCSTIMQSRKPWQILMQPWAGYLSISMCAKSDVDSESQSDSQTWPQPCYTCPWFKQWSAYRSPAIMTLWLHQQQLQTRFKA